MPMLAYWKQKVSKLRLEMYLGSRNKKASRQWRRRLLCQTCPKITQISKQCLKITEKMSHFEVVRVLKRNNRIRIFWFFALQFLIFNLFYAVKTLLSKLVILWYLHCKKGNFNAQHWLHCIKKVKNQESRGKKRNVACFVHNTYPRLLKVIFRHCCET